MIEDSVVLLNSQKGGWQVTKKTRFDYGITFNGHHSTEFGLDVISRVIGMPSKKKVVRHSAFSNMRYDFSEVYGGQTYSEREITIVFKLNNWEYKDKNGLNNTWTKVMNWLMGTSEFSNLIDDAMPNYHYLAEVEKGPTWEELRYNGRIKVSFTAYPFRIDVLPEGHDIWDDFNFDLDVAQFTDLEVRGSDNILLINNGISEVTPKIITNAPFTILHDGKEFKVIVGTSQDHDFVLKPGENRMTLRGNGHIEFLFHKELI